MYLWHFLLKIEILTAETMLRVKPWEYSQRQPWIWDIQGKGGSTLSAERTTMSAMVWHQNDSHYEPGHCLKLSRAGGATSRLWGQDASPQERTSPVPGQWDAGGLSKLCLYTRDKVSSVGSPDCLNGNTAGSQWSVKRWDGMSSLCGHSVGSHGVSSQDIIM